MPQSNEANHYYNQLLAPFFKENPNSEDLINKFPMAQAEILTDSLSKVTAAFIQASQPLTDVQAKRVMDESLNILLRTEVATDATWGLKLHGFDVSTFLKGWGALSAFTFALSSELFPRADWSFSVLSSFLVIGSVVLAESFTSKGASQAFMRIEFRKQLLIFRRFFKSIKNQLNWDINAPSPELEYLLRNSVRKILNCADLLSVPPKLVKPFVGEDVELKQLWKQLLK